MCSAACGSVDAIEWLCSKGLEGTVNMKDCTLNDSTPMHNASGELRVDAAQCLYDHGGRPSVTQPNRRGRTPLHTILDFEQDSVIEHQHRWIAMAEWLCRHGARECINHKDKDGHTVLLDAFRRGTAIELCEVLYQYGATDTISDSSVWRAAYMPLSALLWAVGRYGDGMSNDALAVPFHACFEAGDADASHLADAVRMLRLQGPRVLARRPLPPTASNLVVETAVRMGVPLELVQDHPRLAAVLEEAMEQRGVFVEVFLFGCRKSSGSTCLWRIGSPHSLGGLRKAVGEFWGVVLDAEELRRVRGACW